ncbi:MAG: DUF3108 domain-containing protein [Syntrophaceae bacterium]|nr:DUF3108 domain-containing protein [Syntrophaceae bacterium]
MKSGVTYFSFARCIIFVLYAIIFLGLNSAAKEPDKLIPFNPGEKLTYQGRWGTIPAGELTLEVLPKKIVNGVESYHFVMITKTNPTVDLIYKIRERQDSYVDVAMTHSILYRKKTKSKHPRDEILNFNWKKLEVTPTKFGKTKPSIGILPGTFDPLALYYVIRCQDLKENSEILVPLTDGKRNIAVRAIVGKRDIIKVGGKTYAAIEITPDMRMLESLEKNKVVKKGDNAQLKIWVTADKKKIPIKIKTRVGIISFDFDYVPNRSRTRQ